MSGLVVGVIGITSLVGGFGFLSPHCTIYLLFSLVHFSWINRYSMRLVTVMEQIMISIMSHKGKVVLYSLSILLKVFKNLTMGTSVEGGNLFRTKSDFVFVTLLGPKLDISLKSNRGSDLLRKGLNWYPHRIMGILKVNEFTASIMKSAEKMVQLLGRVIAASTGMTILFSALPGCLHSMGLCSTMTKRY